MPSTTLGETRTEPSQPSVLIVDDSKTVRRSASGYLTSLGLSVFTASDGFEALARVVECRPTLVFVDIMMPRLDGYQTCALIKNNAEFRDTPVIMLSSKDGLFDRARGRVAGADDHLSKPFSAEQIVAAVTRHIPREHLAAINARLVDNQPSDDQQLSVDKQSVENQSVENQSDDQKREEQRLKDQHSETQQLDDQPYHTDTHEDSLTVKLHEDTLSIDDHNR